MKQAVGPSGRQAVGQSGRQAVGQSGSRAVGRALRTSAVVIALAAVFDPVFSGIEAWQPPIVAVNLSSSSVDETLDRLQQQLPGRRLELRDGHSGPLPCGSEEDCVLLADGTVGADWERGLRAVSLVTLPSPQGPNVRIESVTAPGAHRSAAGVVQVRLSALGVEGRRTVVRVFDGSAIVGSVTHDWTNAATATLEVPWWPLDGGARALRVEAVPTDGEVTSTDNRIDVGATVISDRVPVLVFDARPSWQSTYVRRALEDDPRFVVAHRSWVAPLLSTGTASGRLDAATLDRVPLVVIGAPDGLTGGDVDLLESFVRVRGGSLLLLPEQRPSGPSSRLFDGTWTERLSAASQPVGPLRASELLLASGVSRASTIIARSGDAPVIVSVPMDAGRVIVAGAMDAWRNRDDVFGRFWQSLAHQAASAGAALTVSVDEVLVRDGGRVRFTIHDRRMAPQAASEAGAVQRCGDAPAAALRLWPGGRAGEFMGESSPVASGSCEIEVTSGDRQLHVSVASVAQPSRGIPRTIANLERHVRANGGMVAAAGDEGAIARALSDVDPMSRVVSVYPMRSAWWMLPFAACLSIEWWLRRRNGLR